MNTLKIYQVDAFAEMTFQGNPAAVLYLDEWLDDSLLQNIAMENNLSETAFFVKNSDDIFHIRWFTPSVEVDLCGHATLASAHVLFTQYNYGKGTIIFESKSGKLTVKKINLGYQMNFPSDIGQKIQDVRPFQNLCNKNITEVYKGKDDFMVVLENQNAIEELEVDLSAISALKSRGCLFTAAGHEVDFVSRCFFPNAGVNEDPVTGSAHTFLTPFWATRLNKNTLKAKQLSRRGGSLQCEYKDDRVLLTGTAITYLEGFINL